ncbi:hypothetical protein [Streptomyces sp. NPDC056049]|uniref:hypothetical protein n=1 Tax=Streptomyces sp. NPDC056049 TaxID=3345693 RepID=UPI0035DEC99F
MTPAAAAPSRPPHPTTPRRTGALGRIDSPVRTGAPCRSGAARTDTPCPSDSLRPSGALRPADTLRPCGAPRPSGAVLPGVLGPSGEAPTDARRLRAHGGPGAAPTEEVPR